MSVNWVEGSKTLREQGVEATETLLLRRRLFFSDRNVDSRDPVQLTLLYVQARDAILAGTHPITQEKGIYIICISLSLPISVSISIYC